MHIKSTLNIIRIVCFICQINLYQKKFYGVFQYVKRQYPSIVNENVDITNDNAKKIFATISEADYGNEEHINDLIQKLAYKWSMEDSLNKKEWKKL